MDFQEADKAYKDLRAQHAAGQLNDADFEAQVNGLKVQDAQGRWWQLGVRSGEWYYNDGQNWVKSRPPTTSPAAPSSSPEDSAGEKPTAAGATASLPPRRLFSANPVDRDGGGLPRGVLIGIIAGVAVIAIVCILVVYSFLTSNNNLNPFRAVATATRTQVAIAPSPALPTLPPPPPVATPAPPTLLPSPSPTVTNTVASPTTPRPTAVPRPSATATSATARVTNTPNVPPGIYVTKMVAENITPEGSTNFHFNFRITFYNNTGGNWHNPTENGWVVLVYQVNNQGGNPFGQTRVVRDIDIPPGTNDIVLTGNAGSPAWPIGPSGPPDCNYVAGTFRNDENNKAVAFPQLDGKQFRLSFSACR